MTRLLIGINAAVFLYELFMGPRVSQLFLQWGLVPLRVTQAFGPGAEPAAPVALTFLTSMFLHGGWMHLIGNMWFLWIFGDNIEDRMGKFRFILFYLSAGLVAAGLQFLLHPESSVPTIGASGAIAGVLGAYALLYPGARVHTLLPVFPFFQIVPLPAVLVLGLWFVLQFFIGALALGVKAGGGVAWWAHIGGFAFGLVTVKLFERRRRETSSAWVES